MNYFDDRIAPRYDTSGRTSGRRRSSTRPWTSSPRWRGPEPPLELGVGTGSSRSPQPARRARARYRPLPRDAGPAPGQAGRRRDRHDRRRLRHRDGGGLIRPRLPRAQHDHEPHDPGRTGGVLPQRRPAPRAGRALRDRGRRPRPAATPAGRDGATVHRDPDPPRLRRDRRRHPDRASHHYWVVDGRLETFSAPFRYVWPSELDLMARIAGMELRERWGDWDRSPFTSESHSHVSVWEKPR